MLHEVAEKILICAGLVLFAIFGACVKWVNPSNVRPTRARVFIAEAITASFIGFLAYWVYLWLYLPEALAFIAAGLGGWGGTKSIDIIAVNMSKHFKLEGFKPDPDVAALTDAQLQQLAMIIEQKKLKAHVDPVEAPTDEIIDVEVIPTEAVGPKKPRRTKKQTEEAPTVTEGDDKTETA